MPGKGNFQPAKLDVDPSILDRNLQIFDDADDENEFTSILKQFSGPASSKIETLIPESSYPSITVQPSPGLCVKTRTKNGDKFFLNICKLKEIPSPPPMSEDELQRIIAEEDYTNLWRVPMSLGAPRTEKDKSGKECTAADVAVNATWFDTIMEPSVVFTTFVITVAIEAVGDKYGEEATLDREGWVILKNKKFHGDSCPKHTIQQRGNAGIAEIGKESMSDKNSGESQPAITEIKTNRNQEKLPKFKIVKDKIEDPTTLTASIELPGILNKKDVLLDVGEDRLVVTTKRLGYHLDIFLPHSIDQDETVANFLSTSSTLQIKLPLQRS